MLGEPVSADQAEQWGLIWRAVPDGELMPEAERIAAHLATQPTQALGRSSARWTPRRPTLDQQLDLERDLQREAAPPPTSTRGREPS